MDEYGARPAITSGLRDAIPPAIATGREPESLTVRTMPSDVGLGALLWRSAAEEKKNQYRVTHSAPLSARSLQVN